MIRAAAPDLWFLSPGVGAQGGELESGVESGSTQRRQRDVDPHLARNFPRRKSRQSRGRNPDQIVNIKRDLNRYIGDREKIFKISVLRVNRDK